ncbi:hypothetical protein AGABI1DRAFT_107339 [Agaricus bisporus var. burnettii JB137-S8]|uniref:DUF6534 domain-containing protein n=1 Tax=Agaricus bisporus var. burnettii (strain JB137-S8 / ATCC MYA-4627 / FGSC 10392) TaxID=597362 RepID=K5X6P7_AGABU|nr:uncharacterized protein AGABI1DRAFT_107339 [Agaricus bisporus var. burnettii JB137-S8]EKM78888.1 hypothetical protein AGABI1DRAFT_107339 [Agaricus bisporus var. burnettii JB137-S8]
MATVNIQPTIGTFFIAAITDVGLLGIATMQCFRYFLNFPDDPLLMKLVVAFVWVLEFLKSTLAINGAYDTAVVHWGDAIDLSNPNWQVYLTILVCMPYSNHRGYLLSLMIRKSIMIFTSVAHAWGSSWEEIFGPYLSALGVGAYAESILATQYEDADFTLTDRLTMASLGCALLVDWSVTGCLVFLFKEQRSSFNKTQRLMKKLIFYTVNIGLLTSICDLVVLILLNINFHPFDALYSIAVFEVLGNLYSNSLLAWLNSRTILSDELNRTRDLEHTSIAFRARDQFSTTQVSDTTPHRTTSNVSQVVFATQAYPVTKNKASLRAESDSE